MPTESTPGLNTHIHHILTAVIRGLTDGQFVFPAACLHIESLPSAPDDVTVAALHSLFPAPVPWTLQQILTAYRAVVYYEAIVTSLGWTRMGDEMLYIEDLALQQRCVKARNALSWQVAEDDQSRFVSQRPVLDDAMIAHFRRQGSQTPVV